MIMTAKDKIVEIADEIIDKFKLLSIDGNKFAISDYEHDNNYFKDLSGDFLFTPDKSDAHKKLSSMLIDGYEELSSDIKKEFKRDFFRNVEKRCPFCGQLLETSGKSASDVPTADLDHFFPKHKYPQFALNPQNLIPTCMECNRIEKHIKTITPREFKEALENLKLYKAFQKHPESHFKIYNALDYDFNSSNIINSENKSVLRLVRLYGLEERFLNIKNKSFNILLNIVRNFEIKTPESLERFLENMASSNWHEINDGYSLNNSPQIWQEFIESILYDECKLTALWDEVKSMNMSIF